MYCLLYTCDLNGAEPAVICILFSVFLTPMPNAKPPTDPIAFHANNGGKICVGARAPLRGAADLALAYTPGVAEPCRAIAERPQEANRLTWRGNAVAVVTDGSAVLGLGDIGPLAALPVMEGKCALFKKFANIDAVPLCLAERDTDAFVRAVAALEPSFSGINLEDIAAPRCFEIEKRLKERMNIPIFHDDQHGTACVSLAALLNALRVVGKQLPEVRVVISGAGAAGVAVAKLLMVAGARSLRICDSVGILSPSRQDLNPAKLALAKATNAECQNGTLASAMAGADVFIGLSKGGLVPGKMVASMAPKAIVFAMANPEPEILPDAARAAGAAVVATGRSDFANQVNNALVFPGVFLGALQSGTVDITGKHLCRAAQNLAALVPRPTARRILPGVFHSRVASAVARAF